MFRKKIKLIYLSTSYVYPGLKEITMKLTHYYPLIIMLGQNLVVRAAVQMYKNSLILRLSMTEKPFVHKKAFTNVKTNFIYHDEVANLLLKLLKNKGIIMLAVKFNLYTILLKKKIIRSKNHY